MAPDDRQRGGLVMVGEYLLRGLAAGAWVIGLMTALGLFCAFVWLFCTVMAWAFGEDKP